MSGLLPYITRQRRKTIANDLFSDADPKLEFYIFTGLSAIVVTLGLIVDSSPVVIGAMLIAPLFAPMMAASLAVVMGRVGKFQVALLTLARAVFGVVALAMIVSLFSPFRDSPGIEILSRTDPNLIHLFIALFSGLAGAFALVLPRLSVSLAGVLISTALIPPLGVVGHSVVAGDFAAASGAFLLFLTNLLVIIFSSTVLFLLLGFRPDHRQREEDAELLRKDLQWSVLLIFLLAIPLTYSLITAVQQNNREKAVERQLVEQFNLSSRSRIDSMFIRANRNQIDVSLTIHLESNITQQDLDALRTTLFEQLDAPVNLNITRIPVQVFN